MRWIAMLAAALGVVVLIGAGSIPGIKPDADAYWLAALRVRAGQELYLPAASYADPIDIYRYAPWFAYAWVPLTYLPQDVAYTLWRALLVVAAGATVIPILRRPTPAGMLLSLLMVGLLISNVRAANVAALIVGSLALALPTRAGPVALGVAGSLKIFPLLLVMGYLAERRWRDGLTSVAVAAVLWAPVLLFNAASYPTELGGVSLYGVAPLAWLASTCAVGLAVVVLAWRGSRWTWLAAAAAIPLAVPRIWLPDASYVACVAGLLDPREGQEQSRR